MLNNSLVWCGRFFYSKFLCCGLSLFCLADKKKSYPLYRVLCFIAFTNFCYLPNLVAFPKSIFTQAITEITINPYLNPYRPGPWTKLPHDKDFCVLSEWFLKPWQMVYTSWQKARWFVMFIGAVKFHPFKSFLVGLIVQSGDPCPFNCYMIYGLVWLAR